MYVLVVPNEATGFCACGAGSFTKGSYAFGAGVLYTIHAAPMRHANSAARRGARRPPSAVVFVRHALS